MSKRTLSLAAAIALAALGTMALVGYMRGLEEQTLSQIDSVAVLVAKETVPAGTSAEDATRRGLLVSADVPRKALVDGVITDVNDIKGRIAKVDIVRGEQVLRERFVAPAPSRGAFAIPAGHQAMSVDVAASPGVAGFVRAGDHVSVIGGAESRVGFIVQDVLVLTVGAKSEPKATTPTGGSTVQSRVLLTLAVTPIEAEKVAYAVLKGQIYFTLLPQSARAEATPGRAAENLFS